MVFDGFIFRQRKIYLNNKYVKNHLLLYLDGIWCLTTNVIYINSIHFKHVCGMSCSKLR